MSDIKISVLIYVLNDQIHIEKCIRSVMKQSLQELEILLIDGGSTDGTLEILQRLQKEDSRIRIIASESGVGRQFNIGLRTASGKYIGVCESDDYVLPDMYERQYEIAEKYDLDVLKANIIRFCENAGKQYSFQFSLSSDRTLYNSLLYPQEDLRFLKLGVNGFWSGLYNREFLLQNQIFMNETTGASYQDITFSFFTELYAKRAYVMSDAFYCYRMDNPNSSVNSPKKITSLNVEYQLLKEQLKARQIWEAYKEIYWKWRLGGYLWFYDNISDEMKKEYLPIFYQDIKDEMKSELYLGTELSGKEQELCNTGKMSYEKFQDYIKMIDSAWEKTEQQFRNLNFWGDIVIFGTGNLGFLVNCYLEQSGKRAVAAIDNASWKWDQIVNGLLVLSPKEGVRNYPDAVYIIANDVHAGEMRDQIERLGVVADNIMICNHYDLFLKKMLVKNITENSIKLTLSGEKKEKE